MLNVCKIPRKEPQVVDFWVTDERGASGILSWRFLEYVSLIKPDWKKLKMTKLLWLTIFSTLKGQQIWMTVSEELVEKRRWVLLI